MKKNVTPPDLSDASNVWTDFQQIDESGDIFEQIFQYSIIPTLVHDMDLNIIDVNDSALDAFGFSRKELLKMSMRDLHTDDELDHSSEVQKQMQKERKMHVETKFKRKDGTVFIARVSPCKYVIGGKPVIHVSIQDITERKQNEKKLLELNNALEVELRKGDYYAEALESKNKELEEFAYVAAHDLKAPATNLITLAEMIPPEAVEDKDNRELLARLKSSIGLMYKTVHTLNDVINFKTTLKDRKERLQFAEIFDDVKQGIAGQLEEADASLKTDFSRCPQIDYPPLHLKSVIQNLLTNAVKYKEPDKPLHIALSTSLHNGRICLRIKDNGLGFDADKYHRKVLGLFTRLHTHVDGKGVGLHIVKSIIDTHGGKIEVKSKPREGATFTVYLTPANDE